MVLTKEQYNVTDEYLEWLRRKNFKERTMVTLIENKEERIEKVEQLENESNAINVLIQILNNVKVKEE